MQDQVKDIVLTGDQNGLELNSKYVKETIVECELGIWGPKKNYTCRHAKWQVQLKTATQQKMLLF